ncbi:MAG: zinc ribbon domain-containing protein [Acidobacteriia bacterium]|nr:zinc ribbon domain-containing protein [Terriglobia bacterium]
MKAETAMDCPNCSQALSERGSFCKNCGAQARCLQCKELLEPAAKACVECGTLVGHGNPAASVNGTSHTDLPQEMPANRNTITYREDRNSRDFQASLTDTSMQSVGTVLAEVFAQRGVGRVTPHSQHTFSKESPVIDALKGIAAPEHTGEQTPPNTHETPPPAPELTNIARLFRATGDTLE